MASYERDFMECYRPCKFSGIDEMLERLNTRGLRLGLVTSNTRANVEPALGSAIRYFDSRAIFFFEHESVSKAKSASLVEGARCLEVNAAACVYVGDQPADADAAAAAGMRFLGVTYGWGIPQG